MPVVSCDTLCKGQVLSPPVSETISHLTIDRSVMRTEMSRTDPVCSYSSVLSLDKSSLQICEGFYEMNYSDFERTFLFQKTIIHQSLKVSSFITDAQH